MRHSLVVDLFRYLAKKQGFSVDHAPKAIERRVEALNLPTDIKRLLQWHWPRTNALIGPYDLMPTEFILAHPDFSRLTAAQMIPIGTALNGDLLVIRFTAPGQAEVGLMSHVELWEKNNIGDQAYARVSPTVEEYLHRAAEGRFLPVDFFCARELESLLLDRQKSGRD